MTVVHCKQRMMKVLGRGRSAFISWHSGERGERRRKGLESPQGAFPAALSVPSLQTSSSLTQFHQLRSTQAQPGWLPPMQRQRGREGQRQGTKSLGKVGEDPLPASLEVRRAPHPRPTFSKLTWATHLQQRSCSKGVSCDPQLRASLCSQ